MSIQYSRRNSGGNMTRFQIPDICDCLGLTEAQTMALAAVICGALQ